MKIKIIALILLLTLLLTACKKNNGGSPQGGGGQSDNLGDDTSYGEDLEDLGAMDGFFEEDICDVDVKCVSGTPGCYKMEGNVLTFTSVGAESVYSISGKLSGSIVILSIPTLHRPR